jgi:AraC-like DNA-binding protein
VEKPINVLASCHLKSEPEDYRLMREKGQNAVNFVHFLSPVDIVVDGVTLSMAKDACIVYTPGVRQEYAPHHSMLLNSFVTFMPPPTFLTSYSLPLNEPFYVRDGSKITRVVEKITWAVADSRGSKEWAMNEGESIDLKIAGWVRELFDLLARVQIGDSPKDRRDYMIKRRFAALRGDIRLNPGSWSVEKMAKYVWLTRSRFSIVYKELFGVTPNADLMDASIEQAKALLVSGEQPFVEIARVCGYKSVEHFARLFRASVGSTPGQYRKDAKKPEG